MPNDNGNAVQTLLWNNNCLILILTLLVELINLKFHEINSFQFIKRNALSPPFSLFLSTSLSIHSVTSESHCCRRRRALWSRVTRAHGGAPRSTVETQPIRNRSWPGQVERKVLYSDCGLDREFSLSTEARWIACECRRPLPILWLWSPRCSPRRSRNSRIDPGVPALFCWKFGKECDLQRRGNCDFD